VDIRSETQVKRWADEIGRRAPHIDVLVNNAAVLGERARFATIPSDVWKNTLRTNILGTILVTRSLLSLLQGSDAGLIVNVGSIVGRHGRAGFSTYAVSKFAIDGLTQSLAQELASERIRVVSLLPSRVATELRRQAYETDPLESQRNVDDYLAAVDALIATAGTCLTGVALSSADISFWRL
jgi:NAD(P)-dependent dehydrogenase (short-subunit alcohol dehydrogenase family)